MMYHMKMSAKLHEIIIKMICIKIVLEQIKYKKFRVPLTSLSSHVIQKTAVLFAVYLFETCHEFRGSIVG